MTDNLYHDEDVVKDTCPNCGAPMRGGQCLNFSVLNYEDGDVFNACDYAAGLLGRAERAEAERDEARKDYSRVAMADREGNVMLDKKARLYEAALREIADGAGGGEQRCLNIARETLEAGNE